MRCSLLTVKIFLKCLFSFVTVGERDKASAPPSLPERITFQQLNFGKQTPQGRHQEDDLREDYTDHIGEEQEREERLWPSDDA